MLAYLVVAVAVLCLIHVLLNYSKKARLLKKIPGPKDVFIVGNALELLVSPVELFRLGRTFTNRWKDIYRFWSPVFAAVAIYNPKDIEVVVSTMKHSEKANYYSFLRPWLGDGLLLSAGTKWQQRRKILTPAFHFNILRDFCAVLDENSHRLVNKLSSQLGEPVDIGPILSQFTLNSICETAMGTQLDDKGSRLAKTYKEAIYKVGKLMVDRFSKVYLYPDIIYNLTLFKKQQKAYVKTIHEFTTKVINERKDYTNENDKELGGSEDINEDDNLNLKKKRTALLDLLISAQKDGFMDRQGIQEEVDTFMFEGHDTTASGLIFCLMLLANNKPIQDKIVAELTETLGVTERIINLEDLSKLKYLERCIKESLRLYPPVNFISRILSETTQLSNYTVPAGTFCHIEIYDLHRREDLFKNPLKYDPDRFLPENSVDRHPYSYIPFSAGPRNCIGQKFAIMEMKIAVLAILREYELHRVTTPNDIQISSDVVLRNDGPIYVSFTKRNEQIKRE